ncbi:protein MAIN-LIKE 1-like [Gossypium hirsutum]|uniref:Protein MAIN-LIKE 1-like n=1 Tax=Gossypium hirsutum TaxID=3635 RepID=A0ABM2ZBQ4_GOSHI|nr:protein MAIN-LIKE 1-like [Gossypium hirsutum]
MPYLRLAGFGDVALIQMFDLRPNLLSALVERWCTETHTFIMPYGECTVTLKDVAMQLGLRVDGAVVTGRSKVLEPSVVCHRLLGQSPRDGEQNFTCLTLAWLRANFKVHLKYLPLLEDFSRAGSYSWGSAVLAALYYELCRVTKHGVSNMAGCLGLLQSWALYRMPFLAAMSDVSRNWCEPDINYLPSNDRGFLWMPYSTINIATLIPQRVHAEARMWCINTSVLNFSTVEWYNGDRVMGQFGCKQFVPVEPQQFADVHGGSSPFDLEQPPTSVDMFGNNMYSTPPQATIDPVANPSDVYNTPQRPPRQRRPVNRYTPNDDTTPGSFQF